MTQLLRTCFSQVQISVGRLAHAVRDSTPAQPVEGEQKEDQGWKPDTIPQATQAPGLFETPVKICEAVSF